MLAVASVGLRRFLRERSNIFFVFVLPFLIIFLVGFGFGSESGADLGVVGADSEVGAAVLEHVAEDRITRYDDQDEALRAVEQTEVSAAAIFPADPSQPIRFLARAEAGIAARSQLEEAVSIENQQIAVARQAGLVGASDADVARAAAAVGTIGVETERVGDVLFEGLSNFDASALTQVILFTFLSALTASSFLIQDRELGMARRKASAPIATSRLLLGETLGRFWIAMFQAGLIVAVTAVAFGVDWGDLLATGALLVLFGLVSTGAGIFLGSALDNAEAASGIGVMTGLVLAALGGSMAPVEIFPPAMQTVARFTPHYWAVEGLKVSVAGGGIDQITESLAVLAAIAVGLLATSVMFYRRKVFANR